MIIRLNGQLPVLFAAIDQDRQLDSSRPAIINQLIKSSTNGAPGIKHVIYQHYVPAFDVTGKFRAIDDGFGSYR